MITGAEIIPFEGPSELASIAAKPSALFVAGPKASERFWEFFTANILNKNTRRAYYRAACRFSDWCESRGLDDLGLVKPIHVAGYIEELLRALSKPSVKQHLARLRMLFDWLVVRHVMDVNPAHAVRGPKHSQTKGKTPVLTAEEARTLLDSIETGSVVGLRDSRSYRADGVYVRPCRRGGGNESRGLLYPGSPRQGAAA